MKTFVEDFTHKVNKTLQEQETKTSSPHKNLTKEEEKALKDLMKRNDIIICNADKGGAVVILDVKDYIEEAERQISDEHFYKKLSSDPTELHTALVNNAIDNLKNRNLISHKLAEGLKVSNPRTPLLYLLPKIHKPNNPGRPVVSSVSCHTEKISHFVDYHLKPLAQKLPSYIQDTTDFLRKLDQLPKKLPKDCFLVTMDVKSLYTNIPNQEGIEACKSYLYNSNNRNLIPVISTFLTLILTLNNFQFNDQNILQVNGASMGSKCSTNYANLFMGKFEELHILPIIRDKILYYCRFIDDIFFIWFGTKDELTQAINVLNNAHPTIKLDVKYSKERIDFLDTTVMITNDQGITTTLYVKPTDAKGYLHAKSYHPNSTKKAIAFSQALRIKRICSDDSDYKKRKETLLNKFVERGYEREETKRNIDKADHHKREDLLQYKENTPRNNIPFITKYNKNMPNIKDVFNSTWNTLLINPNIATKFSQKPVLCFRRNQNLKELIGQTRLSNGRVVKKQEKKTGKCSPCHSRIDTKCCKHIITTTKFRNQSKASSKEYQIFHHLNCKSKDVIYLVECRQCNNKPYIGKCERQMISNRITKHRHDAKDPNSIQVDRHFLLPGHNFDRDFKLTIIEGINNKNMTREKIRNTLEHREDFWILKLGTLHPYGFNDKLNYPMK